MLGSLGLLSIAVLGSSSQRLPDVVVPQKSVSSVTLRVKQRLVIALSENRSTGASWQVKKSGAPGLKLLETKNVDDRKEKPPGAPSKIQYIFVATKAGKYSIDLVYGRPWLLEKGEKPWERVQVKATIKR